MKHLRVLGYASGSPLSYMVLRRVAAEHDLVAVVTPSGRLGLRARMARWIGRGRWRGIDAKIVGEGSAARLSPDLIVVASYPKILPLAVLERARIGALNVHTSLLPRHRGIDPIFSTYWYDDAEAGVTIHWMDAGVDSGDIAAQQAVSLERGHPSRDLYFDLAGRAANLVSDVLRRIAAGESPRTPQVPHEATAMSGADIARAKIPFAEWPAERVWHLLRGLGDQRSGLVAGLPANSRATGWHASANVKPGQIDAVPNGFELHCRDGLVSVEV